ncbi:MAG: molybdopterin oxidoreductase family protein [Paludisphaera borealis]|uniref:molybdopterin oxidoreductase family protein n=1 Tax=Paludisphaera borealis TaxID=1387353 RepID=UPI002847C79A|nr:molybdopterin oxidoreductase family protein [Paludisphaera borealis]MDR3621913.1 molybdopterin oxidoreductase family protein [Paludisphaera borealis]
MTSITALPITDLAVQSHCPYCALQCGMLFGAGSPDLPASVMGDPHFPVNNGDLCIKGWTSTELLRHPKRLTSPLVRSRGELRTASWDAALDAVADAIIETRDAYGPDAVGLFGSGALSNEKAYLLGKFARVAVGTANIDYNGRFCMASGAAAGNRAFGIDRGLPFPLADIVDAEVILVVGGNPADTLPPVMQWFDRQKKAGGRLIVSDPRRTATARAADLHLQGTPGSDLALANGLLYLAIEEGLIDREYVADRTNGFDAARRSALAYHPAVVERRTGVSEADLRKAVRWLGSAKSAMILSGRGPEQQSKGVDTSQAYINLALALGLPGRPNSGWGTLTGQGNGQGGREHGQKADQLPGYRLIEVDAHREAVARVWEVDPASLPRKGLSAFEMLDSAGSVGGVRTLLVMGSNVAVASPDAGRIDQRLRSLDHLTVCDAFLNETGSLANVVLPVLQWAEEEGTMTNLEGRVIHRRRVARPPGGVRGDLEILRALADRLGCGPKFAFDDARSVFDELRRATAGAPADYSGITYERIDRERGVFWPCPGEGHPGTPRLFADRFAHPDGRARFLPVADRPAGEEPDDDYPFFFTTGRYKEHYNSGAQTRMVGPLVRARPRPIVLIHPTAAQRHRIVNGSRVTLESRRGRIEFQVEVTADVRPDTLFCPFHWGGEHAANRLTNPALDPISRMPEFKLAAVRIAAVEAGEGDPS